jgi:hypothetical protein
MIMTFSPLTLRHSVLLARPRNMGRGHSLNLQLASYVSRKHFAVHGSQHLVLPGPARWQMQCRKLATTDR